MKIYCGESNTSRTKSIDDIHHKTCDSGYSTRIYTAKAERKAARRFAKQQISKEYECL